MDGSIEQVTPVDVVREQKDLVVECKALEQLASEGWELEVKRHEVDNPREGKSGVQCNMKEAVHAMILTTRGIKYNLVMSPDQFTTLYIQEGLYKDP